MIFNGSCSTTIYPHFETTYVVKDLSVEKNEHLTNELKGEQFTEDSWNFSSCKSPSLEDFIEEVIMQTLHYNLKTCFYLRGRPIPMHVRRPIALTNDYFRFVGLEIYDQVRQASDEKQARVS